MHTNREKLPMHLPKHFSPITYAEHNKKFSNVLVTNASYSTYLKLGYWEMKHSTLRYPWEVITGSIFKNS